MWHLVLCKNIVLTYIVAYLTVTNSVLELNGNQINQDNFYHIRKFVKFSLEVIVWIAVVYFNFCCFLLEKRFP